LLTVVRPANVLGEPRWSPGLKGGVAVGYRSAASRSGWRSLRTATGGARARVDHGRWRISLPLPGVNLDPIPPLYQITIHYSGDHTHTHASATHRIRLESERAGL
jgi:hypothetical protein